MNLQRCCGGPSTVARKGYDAIGLYPVHTAPFPRSVVEAQQGRRLRTGVVPVSALSLSAADGQTKSHNAPEVGKASLHHAQLDADDDGELFDDDDELEIPPLPKELLQLLSEMLSSSSNSDCGDEETLSRLNAHMVSEALPAGAYTNHRPASFCTNCCRPLVGPGNRCSACGHTPGPETDAQLLGDPVAWVQAYEQQLQQQEQEALDQQQSQQQGSQGEAQQEAEPQAGAACCGAAAAGGVLLATDARMLQHRCSLPPHPERPERLQAIMSRLHARGLMSRCRLLRCRPALQRELLAAHTPQHVAAVLALGPPLGPEAAAAMAAAEAAAAPATAPPSTSGLVEQGTPSFPEVPAQTAAGSAPSSSLAPDTLYNAHTRAAALLAAGAAADVGTALASGTARRALAIVRPPGAQAGPSAIRGGCYLNNVAVAARAALAAGARRVMVVDWDLHHGQGTSEVFWEDGRVLVVDAHLHSPDMYPGCSGSGGVEEAGEGAGAGRNVNISITPSGDGRHAASVALTDGDLLSAWLHVVLPLAYQFRPDVVLVAAGFGAIKGDPAGPCNCSPAVFAHLTHMLCGVAPTGLLLEGGYRLSGLADAAEGCLRVMLGETPPPLPGPWGSSSSGWVAIMNAMQIHSQYWGALHPLSLNGWLGVINQQQEQQKSQERQQQRDREDRIRELMAAAAAAGLDTSSVMRPLGSYEEDDDDAREARALAELLAAAGGGKQAVRSSRRQLEDETTEEEEEEEGDEVRNRMDEVLAAILGGDVEGEDDDDDGGLGRKGRTGGW